MGEELEYRAVEWPLVGMTEASVVAAGRLTAPSYPENERQADDSLLALDPRRRRRHPPVFLESRDLTPATVAPATGMAEKTIADILAGIVQDRPQNAGVPGNVRDQGLWLTA